MPQRQWDEHGNLIPAAAGGGRQWDEAGNLITTPAPGPPMQLTAPAGDTPLPPDVAARHERQALTKQARGEMDQGRGTWGAIRHAVDPAMEAMLGLGKGTVEMAKGLGSAYIDPSGVSSHELVKGLVAPQREEFRKGAATTGFERAGHYLAGATPLVGPMAATAGEELGQIRQDPSQLGAAMVHTVAALGPEKIMDMMREPVNLVRTGDAITNGMTRLAKEQVRPTLAKYTDAVKREVGTHADAVINADELRGQQGSRVIVPTDPAAVAAEAKIKTMRGYTPSEAVTDFINDARQGIARVTPTNTAPGSLGSVKALITDVSGAISKMRRTGALDDAAVLTELRTGLKDAAQAHANQLGPEYGRSWKQYKEVHAAKVERMGELMGDLQEGLAGPDTVSKLVHPDNASQFHQLVKEMKDYGIDTLPIESAREYGYKLQDTLSKTSNLFFGKLRAMIKYPWAAAPVAIGASEVAKLSGVPGMSFALPLIAAGKVAGLLDMRQMRILLEDIQAGRMAEPRPAPTGAISPYERTMPPPMRPPTRQGGIPGPAGGGGAPGPGTPAPAPPAAPSGGGGGVAAAQEAIDEAETRRELAGKLRGARKAKGAQSSAERAAETQSSGTEQDYQRALKGRRIREYFEKKKGGTE